MSFILVDQSRSAGYVLTEITKSIYSIDGTNKNFRHTYDDAIQL